MSATGHSQAAESQGWQRSQSAPKLIIKADSIKDIQAILSDHGMSTSAIRPVSGGAHVIDIGESEISVPDALEKIQEDPRIDYAVVNSSINLLGAASEIELSPDDPFASEQWQLGSNNLMPSAVNLYQAWQVTHGSQQTTVAVIDTGVRYDHPDMVGRLLPGFDFVTSVTLANDGDGRDEDASDPGNFVDSELRLQLQDLGIDCPVSESSWHGTAVASIIAANSNDRYGMAGVDRHAQVLPVRVVGRCEGSRSDFLDAIRWAAGVEDPHLPYNPTPARIINISLAIQDGCSKADQSAVNDARLAGAIIVAAAGNNNRNLDYHPTSPATCDGVLSVAAITAGGRLAEYSNYGSSIDLGAPGGDDLGTVRFPIVTASYRSTDDTTLVSNHRVYSGTSMAAPMVSGVLSLMLSISPELSVDEMVYLLTRSTNSYSSVSGCDIDSCGAGMLDANLAMRNTLAYVDNNLFEDMIVSEELSYTSQSHEEMVGAGGVSFRTVAILLILLLLRQRLKLFVSIPSRCFIRCS